MLNLFNIYYNIVNKLDGDIALGRLPQAFLFLGPNYSGKLISAFHLIRKLNCKDKFLLSGDIECDCSFCKNFYKSFILLGNKNIHFEKYFDLYKDKKITLDMFCDFVLVFLKRLEVFEKDKKDIEAIDRIKDFLKTRNSLSLIKDFEYLHDKFLKKNVSVDMIKQAIAFLKEGSKDFEYKFLIIEHIENLSVNAFNLLLKTTEEPQHGSIIVFTSADKSKILQTILSRVRLYNFISLKKQIQKDIIYKKYGLVEESFLSMFLTDEQKTILESADNFYLCLKENNKFVKSQYSIEKNNFELFLNRLYENIKYDSLNINSVYKVDILLKLIQKEYQGAKVYNIPFSSILENILIKFRQHNVV